MLDNFRETAITWDKANRKVYEPLRASAGDNKGRKLSVQVVNGGVIENLSGASLSLFWETKDKAHKGLDAFTAVDATKGEFETYYTTGMLSNEGTLNANLVLVDANGRIVSESFTITVFKGIDDDAIQSSDSFTALTQALIDISNLEQNYTPRLNDLTAQLQQSITPMRYGELTVPNWFTPSLPCHIYRDTDGVAKHDMDFNTYKKGTKIYVDKTNGLDSNDGSTNDPFATLKYALRAVMDGTESDYLIVVRNDYVFYRNESFNQGEMTFNNKRIAIVPEDENERIVLTTGVDNAEWTVDSGIWKTTRSVTYGVYDLDYKDTYGSYVPYKNKATFSECVGEKGSWYTDGTDVWVNTLSGTQPTNKIIVGTYEPVLFANLTNNSVLYYENCDFLSTASGSYNGSAVRGDLLNDEPTGEFVAKNCTFSGGDTRLDGTSGNAFYGGRMKNIFLFDCVAAYATRDGFNFDAPASLNIANKRKSLALLFNCVSYDNGLQQTGSTNNAFTAHNAMSILQVGCVGYNTTGPILAHVDGADAVLIDCRMRDSVRKSDMFQFYDSKENGANIYLENCEAGGHGRYDLSSSVLPVSIKGFKGTRLDGSDITILP